MERYENLDGLRAYSAVAIILMHVRANGSFAINGFFYNSVDSLLSKLLGISPRLAA